MMPAAGRSVMRYSSAKLGRALVIRLEDGDVVHECIEEAARAEGIARAAVILLGGADGGSRLVVGPEDGRADHLVHVVERALHGHDGVGAPILGAYDDAAAAVGAAQQDDGGARDAFGSRRLLDALVDDVPVFQTDDERAAQFRRAVSHDGPPCCGHHIPTLRTPPSVNLATLGPVPSSLVTGPAAAAPPSARALLRDVFGFRDYKLNQEEIVDRLVAGGDAFVLMPTGGGKSLCYQLPALVRAGAGIVVSPLISLMKDQVDALQAAGVSAAAYNS